MAKRLDEERQNKLQPIRMQKALEELKKMGFSPNQIDETTLSFEFKKSIIKYFPYSGWASGKTIKDGRGLKKLLNQLK